MDLVGKLNRWSGIISIHVTDPRLYKSSSSRHRKRLDDQVCIGEDFSKLAKYE